MLQQQDEVEAEVTWEDQEMINRFSLLNTRKFELISDLEELKKEDSLLEDGIGELYLAEEEGAARLLVGETLFHLDKDAAVSKLEADQERLQEEVAALEKELDETRSTMAQLKVKLYAKFKNSINLDDE
mmetsp:Transcript_7373/g.31312  ORF Transcript_7373/g.31312 Transcript_7373/m.31312 type:complete len:129 (-) Transcript_7373:67-453(-)|eukprot:CAMPEP_0114635704 /NCGR_PEP_ID=MMETSP0168-20121206/16616_1 /TAXON_ID=95228 ORGANISM="Vannella sp., Strain DIVA3 517/6/12" /NCGR_SAMPLE_ID=MMETSP0168 /ASSEMBLY_ACC=CAM_ASM_000044 /LENGTH=128 /DNA_ID=CAMNT_0001847411 /DNA_START=28 /DNA_END=414 /DNA_ORIENTATION=-